MKVIDKKGHVYEVSPSPYNDPFKNICPLCGEKLTLKKIKKQRNIFSRGIRSFECISCGYAEYDSNEREAAITNGNFDNEL